MIDDLKDHLRQEHGIHEAPMVDGDDPPEASYGPSATIEQLEDMHRQHHTDNPDLLRHAHPDEGDQGR